MNSESQNIEYKESWNDKYLEWICGFANAQGGCIYIGIDDDKRVVGLKDSKRLMEDIPNKIVMHLGIVADVNLLHESDKAYIEISVQPCPMPISYRGKYHYRSGSTKQVLNGTDLQQFILQKMGRSWDEFPRETTDIDCIDSNAIDYFVTKGIASGRIDSDERNATADQVMESVGLPLPKVENFCGGTLVTIMRPTENPYKDEPTQGNKDTNVGINVGKENDIELTERQINIVGLISLYPTITVSEMSEKMSEKNPITTRTIERDMAFLQNQGIIKREGGRKTGRWVVLVNQSNN